MTEQPDTWGVEPALRRAVEAEAPVVLAVRRAEKWINLTSRFLAVKQGCLVLAPPRAEHALPVPLRAGREVYLTFRDGADRLGATSAVAGPPGREGTIAVFLPGTIQRFPRRAAPRVELPEGACPRAWFWLGGKDHQPADSGDPRPIWPARVVDLSTGGTRLLIDRNAAAVIDIGDRVGLELRLPPDGPALRLDAQSRHVQPPVDADRGVLVGFCFLGTENNPALRSALAEAVEAVGRLRQAAEPVEAVEAAAGAS